MPKILGIIPARFHSQRLPGKVMIDIGGKTMIQRVYEQSLKARLLDKVIVATDHPMVFDHIVAIGGEAWMTDENHSNGTSRCAEIAEKLKDDYSVIINIQGDEPFIDPNQIDLIAELFDDSNTQIATLIKKIEENYQIFDEKEAKVIFNDKQEAIYFSRSPIPYLHQKPKDNWIEFMPFYKHLGLYGFQTDVLLKAVQLAPHPYEIAESLEQLRWLAHFKIKVAISTQDTLAIDSEADLKLVEKFINKNS